MSAPLLERIPPQSLEAEQAVLGAMFIDHRAVTKALAVLERDDFYSPQHQMIFAAIADLREEGTPADFIAIEVRLRDLGQLEAVGGTSYLLALQEDAPTAEGVTHWARTVTQKAALRKLIQAAGEIRELAQSPGDDGIGAVVTQVKSLVEAATRRALPIADLVPAEALLEDPDKPSWLVEGVLPDAGLVVLAGEGGAGKGWLGTSLGDAVGRGLPWLGQAQFAPSRTGPCVYIDAERGRRYTGKRVKDFRKATGRAPRVDFQFRPAKLNPTWVASLVEDQRPALLILDSLSRLLPPGTKDTDNDAMAEVLGALRDIAERFECCILVIHHFKKRTEFGDNSPKARIRGATAIVNVADVALAAWQEKDGLVRCEVVKSYWGDPARPFLVEWQGGENGGAELVYAGEAEPEKVTKKLLAQEIILAAAESEPRTREFLEGACGKQRISKRTFGDALAELQKTDRLRRSKQGKEAVFGLPA